MRARNVLIGAAIGTAAGVTISRVTRWWRTWGVEPDVAVRDLPGDDIIEDPLAIETRSITIDAPPRAVWPWLVQMGYGRGGWYSYDQLDQRGASASSIVDEWQALAVGDIVPTHPTGGFEVARLEPEAALVLRSDTELVRRQAEAGQQADGGTDGTEKETPGVAMSGAILSSTPQQFKASWAFVLEPLPGGRTRLIERFRVWYGAGSPGSRFVMPFVGFGVFVMMQRQMMGIKTRAESVDDAPAVTASSAVTASPKVERTEETPPTPVGASA
jgi:proline iminopeptidase